MSKHIFGDNRRVATLKWGAEFLSVNFWDVNEDGADIAYPVSLYRYCVPGRVDTYCFDWVSGGSGHGPRVRFFTDTSETLVSAVKLINRDLNKKSVALMLKYACRKHPYFARILLQNLLESISPNSLSTRTVRGVVTAQRIKRKKALSEKLKTTP